MEWLHFGKLRASYRLTRNSRLGTYSARGLYGYNDAFLYGNNFELDEILLMYDQGMPQIIPKKYRGQRQPIRSPILKPLGLTPEERQQLKAFLHAISIRPHPVAIR